MDKAEPKGPSIKDVRSQGEKGRGESKADTCGRRGEGGLWQKAEVLKFEFLPKFSKFKICPVC